MTSKLSLRRSMCRCELGLKLSCGLVKPVGTLTGAGALRRTGGGRRLGSRRTASFGGGASRWSLRLGRDRLARGAGLTRSTANVLRCTECLHDPGHEAVHPLQPCNRLGRRAGVSESSCQSAKVRVDVDRNFKQRALVSACIWCSHST